MAMPLAVVMAMRLAGGLRGGRHASVLLAGLATLVAGLVAATVYGAVFVSPSEVLAAIVGDAERVPRQIVWNLRVPRAGCRWSDRHESGSLRRTPAGRDAQPACRAHGGWCHGGGGSRGDRRARGGAGSSRIPARGCLLRRGGRHGARLCSVLAAQRRNVPRFACCSPAWPSRPCWAPFSLALMTIFSDRVQPVVLWMGGTLAGRSWDHAELIWPYSVVGLVGALALAGRLDVMRLGDQTARVLGVSTETTRIAAMAVACLLAASAVSVAGLVGFVGLIVPYLARSAGGHSQTYVVAASAIGGASLLVWADLGARMVLSPLEMPVGVITALLGGPLFVLMLYRMRYVGGAGA